MKLFVVHYICSLFLSALCLFEAQLVKQDTVRAPPPVIKLPPPPPPPPKTRITIEGGGIPKSHNFNGRIEQDLFRIRGGGVVHGFGEGSHMRNPQFGTIKQGQVGLGVRFPIHHRG
ncbi:unnamed protein product [Ixodes hexagonus]